MEREREERAETVAIEIEILDGINYEEAIFSYGICCP